jgi:hypothetical protein
MQFDSGWLAITAVSALVSLTALVIVAAGVAYLVLKVRRLTRLAKALPGLAADRCRATGQELRTDGRRLADRARRTGRVLRTNLDAVKGAIDEAGKIAASRPLGGPEFLQRLARRRGRHGTTTDA